MPDSLNFGHGFTQIFTDYKIDFERIQMVYIRSVFLQNRRIRIEIKGL